MDICHLKNAELETQHQKYKGGVVLRGDIVKDDSGSYAVFTEQGSSASQNDGSKSHGYHIQIARVHRTSSWRSICLYLVQMEDAPKLLKNPKSECPDIWIRLTRHKWPKSWSSVEDPVVPLERNLYGHPLAGLLKGKAIWENPIEVRLGESFQFWMFIRTPWKRIILISVCGWHQVGCKETKY